MTEKAVGMTIWARRKGLTRYVLFCMYEWKCNIKQIFSAILEAASTIFWKPFSFLLFQYVFCMISGKFKFIWIFNSNYLLIISAPRSIWASPLYRMPTSAFRDIKTNWEKFFITIAKIYWIIKTLHECHLSCLWTRMGLWLLLLLLLYFVLLIC